jgi:D-threo-aldose 1-dehydrogenase
MAVARADGKPWAELTEAGDPLARLVMGSGTLKHDLNTRVAVIERAYDLGIRRFDSSPLYGQGVSQVVVAHALGAHRDEVHIATKLGHFGRRFPGGDALYRHRDVLWGQIHENIRALRRPPDLLQIHEADQRVWWHPPAPERGPLVDPCEPCDYAAAPVMAALHDARDQGLCRAIGLTGNHPAALTPVLRGVEVDTVLVAYNFDPIFRAAGETLMPLAAQRNVTVLLGSVFQSGAYHRPPEESRRLTRDARVIDHFAAFQKLGDEAGLGITQMVMRFMITAAPAARVVLGASRPQQVEECVAAWLDGPLPEDVQRAVEALALPGVESVSVR